MLCKANGLISLKSRSVEQMLKMLLALFYLYLLLMYAISQIHLIRIFGDIKTTYVT